MPSVVQVKVLHRHFKDLQRCDGMLHGYVGSEEQLSELALGHLKFCATASRINTGRCEFIHFEEVLLATASAFVLTIGTSQAGVLQR